jgi:hypothetical protein
MKTVNEESIVIGKRARELDEKHAQELAKDIAEKGLFHPIVVTTYEELVLVAGRHRMRALAIIGEKDPEAKYKFDGKSWFWSHIPVVQVGDLTPQQLIEYELAENVFRLEMHWKDRANALARLHEGFKELDAKHTAADTARAIEAAAPDMTKAHNTLITEINRSTLVTEAMAENPELLAKASSLSEAWTMLRKDTLKGFNRAMSVLMENAPVIHTLHKVDFRNVIFQIKDVDTIVSDPPYGIDADTWTSKFKNDPHRYKDDLQSALDTALDILTYGYHDWTKPMANLFMFCSPELWHHLAEMATLIGWTVWPRPVFWYKSREGIRPWGTQGFAYTCETLLFATKGGKGLLKSVPDVIDIYKISNKEREHGAQKPVDIYEYLIDISSVPGNTILDPTCGSGTIFPACTATKTIGIGCEREPEYYDLAARRLLESSVPPTPGWTVPLSASDLSSLDDLPDIDSLLDELQVADTKTQPELDIALAELSDL